MSELQKAYQECDEWKYRYQEVNKCIDKLLQIISILIEEDLKEYYGGAWNCFTPTAKQDMINAKFFSYYPIQEKKRKHERKVWK